MSHLFECFALLILICFQSIKPGAELEDEKGEYRNAQNKLYVKGKWKLLKEIGKGAEGVVYEGITHEKIVSEFKASKGKSAVAAVKIVSTSLLRSLIFLGK